MLLKSPINIGMIIHPIHNLNRTHIIKMLENGMSTITDEKRIKNYHPDYKNHTSNLFFILKEGRYNEGMGRYYVVEEDDKYICSAGWNKFIYTESTAVLLTRTYVHPKYRGNYVIGHQLLPICVGESQIDHKILWITFNQHYKKVYMWFAKMRNKPNVPSIWRKFNYVGLKNVYNTQQHVYQYHLSALR